MQQQNNGVKRLLKSLQNYFRVRSSRAMNSTQRREIETNENFDTG